MSLPFFFAESIPAPGGLLSLDESTSKHITQVLRMGRGEQLHLTDGLGKRTTAAIIEQTKKSCGVQILEQQIIQPDEPQVTIAISLLKNTARFEWFLEKATELGISELIILLCDRTEKSHFRLDRMKNILVSAMLQSQQCWLPRLHEPVPFKTWLTTGHFQQKYIAHCMEAQKQSLKQIAASTGRTVICIGPEGDFSPEEIQLALAQSCQPVSLGNTRLRTETAAIAAAALLRIQ